MDTTAKVDLRKLQLLNDRIAQVIDALNQVRFSVHGLQHTTGNFIGQVPVTPFGGQVSPFGAWNTPWGMSGIGQAPFMNSVGGLNHTDVVTDPFTAQRLGQELAVRYGHVVPMASPFPYAQAAQYATTFPYAYVPNVVPTV